jgi:hypothetical protein
VIETTQPSADVVSAIQHLLEGRETAWRGVASDSRFQIRRHSVWMSARAIASGAVHPVGMGSRVVVTIRPPILAVAVGIAALLLPVLVSVSEIVQGRYDALSLWALPLVTWAAVIVTFRLESGAVETLLRSLCSGPSSHPFRS